MLNFNRLSLLEKLSNMLIVLVVHMALCSICCSRNKFMGKTNGQEMIVHSLVFRDHSARIRYVTVWRPGSVQL